MAPSVTPSMFTPAYSSVVLGSAHQWMFRLTVSALPAPPRYVILTMTAFAGQSAAAPAPCAGGPCTPQLEPEHCEELMGPGLSALPLPHATSNGAVAMATAMPLKMAYDMRLSPFI